MEHNLVMSRFQGQEFKPSFLAQCTMNFDVRVGQIENRLGSMFEENHVLEEEPK